VHAIGFAEEGKVDVVVDHEQGAGIAGERPQTPRQRQELAPGEQLMAELENLSATAEGACSNGGQALGFLVGGDDVEAGGKEAVVECGSRG
jgi:hypothetical protein